MTTILRVLCLSAALTAAPAAQQPDADLQRAVELLRSGRVEAAAEALTGILQKRPDDSNAQNLLGIIRGEQGRFDEAEKLFRRALEIDPGLTGAAVNLGYLYRRADRHEEALEAFQKADAIQPRDPEIRFNIASLEAEDGRCADALATLETIPAEERHPPHALVQARCYLALGLVGELRDAMDGMRRLLSPHPELLGELAQQMLQAGLHDEVRALLEGIEGPAAASFPVTFHLGAAYEAGGEPGKAAESFRQALLAEPKSVEALKRLSMLAQRRDDWEEMFDLLHQARQLAPNSGSILYGFALAALRTNRVGEAQFAVHQAIQLEPENPQHLYLYAVTLFNIADMASAIENFQKYVAMRPLDPMGHLGLGAALYEGARYDASLAALESCLELSPDLVEPLYYRGMIAQKQGDNEKALALLKTVVGREPKHVPARAGLGMLHFKMGAYADARRELERAIELNPEHATPHYQLSQVLIRLGLREEAQRELQLYTELKAKAEERREAAARLITP